MPKTMKYPVPALVKEMFPLKEGNSCEIGNLTDFTNKFVNFVWTALENLSYLGPKNWKMLPSDLTQTESLSELNSFIKK